MAVSTDKPRRLLRFVTRLALLVPVALLAGGWAVVRFVAPAAIVEPPRQGVGAPAPPDVLARRFTVAEGVELAAWESRPADPARAAIIVLHGIADSKASQAGTLRKLSARGIIGLAPDLRAHGDSGGLASYGWHDKHDLVLLRKALATEHPGVPIGLWGTSYGAAAALQALALDPEYDFAIVESTFADLRDMGRQQIANHTSLPLQWLAPIALAHAGERASFDPAGVSPETAIEGVTVPLLHLHGDADQVIPIEHGRRISRHAGGSDYRFVVIHGGDHFHLRQADPALYDREIDAFLSRVVP